MVKLQMKLSLKKCVPMKNWTKLVRCRRSKLDMLNSPPVKRFFLADDSESETDQGDYCHNWGPLISLHREYEEKIAALEEEIKQTKADTEFWYWKLEELESHLQNQRLQFEIAQNARERSGESDDDVTSQCSCTGQSNVDSSECSSHSQSTADKWQCRICEENEARVIVLPCSHLCVCLKCAKTVQTCPVCEARRNKFFIVGTRY